MNSRNLVIAAVVLVIVLVVGFVGFKAMKKAEAPQTSTPSAETNTEATTPPLQEASSTPEESTEGAGMVKEEGAATFTLTTSGASPKSVTIKKGESVTWENSTSDVVQINSAPHPAHTDYPPLNTVGQVAVGAKKSLSFPTAGTYKWHNHLNPSANGSIVVQ
jgi:plastocyanin